MNNKKVRVWGWWLGGVVVLGLVLVVALRGKEEEPGGGWEVRGEVDVARLEKGPGEGSVSGESMEGVRRGAKVSDGLGDVQRADPQGGRLRHRAGEAMEGAGEEGGQEGQVSAMGPVRWMAPVTDVDVEALEAELDRGEMEQARILTERRERRRSMEVAREAIEPCLEGVRPGVRMGVSWDLETRGGELFMTNVEVPVMGTVQRNAGLDACVIEVLEGWRAPAESDGISLRVEWAYETD